MIRLTFHLLESTTHRLFVFGQSTQDVMLREEVAQWFHERGANAWNEGYDWGWDWSAARMQSVVYLDIKEDQVATEFKLVWM